MSASFEEMQRLLRLPNQSNVEGIRPPTDLEGHHHDFDVSFRRAKQRAVDHWERSYIEALVRRFNGNLSRAGRAVSMDRNHLRSLIERHELPRRPD